MRACCAPVSSAWHAPAKRIMESVQLSYCLLLSRLAHPCCLCSQAAAAASADEEAAKATAATTDRAPKIKNARNAYACFLSAKRAEVIGALAQRLSMEPWTESHPVTCPAVPEATVAVHVNVVSSC